MYVVYEMIERYGVCAIWSMQHTSRNGWMHYPYWQCNDKYWMVPGTVDPMED